MSYSLTPLQEETTRGMLTLPLPHSKIVDAAKCSTRQVRRIKANLLKHGIVRAPKVVHQGRNRKVTEEMKEICIFPLLFLPAGARHRSLRRRRR